MARLPGVYPTVQDGGLGTVAQGGQGQRVVVGVSSLGTVNQMLGFSDLAQVPTKLGSGPLARAVADQLAYGGGQVYAVPALGDVAGVVTPDAGNPVAPAVTITGAPLDAYDLVVTLTRAGAIGTSAFTYSLDGGDTVSVEIATVATYAIPGTGLTLNFAAGAYVLSSLYKFAVSAPKASVSSVQTAIRAALNSVMLYEYIQLAQPADAAMWAALDALALEAENAFRYIYFLCSTAAPGSDPDAWVSARTTEKATFSSKRVQIVAAYAEVVDTLTGQLIVHSLASRIGARASKNEPQIKTAWVQQGPLSGVIAVAPFDVTPNGKVSRFNNAHALTLDQAGFTTVYKLIGRDGVYVVEDRMSAALTSDFTITPNRRVMDRCTEEVRQALLDFVQQGIDTTDLNAALAALIARASTPLRVRQTNGNISRGRVVIPPGQNILASSQLRVQIRIVPLGYLREITEEIAFENPALVAGR